MSVPTLIVATLTIVFGFVVSIFMMFDGEIFKGLFCCIGCVVGFFFILGKSAIQDEENKEKEKERTRRYARWRSPSPSSASSKNDSPKTDKPQEESNSFEARLEKLKEAYNLYYDDEASANEYYMNWQNNDTGRKQKKSDRNKSANSEKNRTSEPNSELKDAYEILGLKNGASKSEVSKAYRNLCKDFHPDMYQSVNLSEKAKKALEAQFRRIKDAYELIIENLK